MKIPRLFFLLVALSLLALSPSIAKAQDAKATVHAVLFYSPSCGHCHYVISETLPPLFEKYGEQFQIIGIDVTQPQGQTLFMSALQKFGVESGGVPFLVIDDLYMVGSQEIPEKLPSLIETYLAQGGVDWPDIPGLREALSVASTSSTDSSADQPDMVQATPVPATVSPSLVSPTGLPDALPVDGGQADWRARFANDLTGNSLAILVLAGMLGSLVWVTVLFQRTSLPPLRTQWNWVVPVLCVLGLGVAGYLSYVETTQVTAVCGPVGDCNTVQQSEYARLFGILPIGVLGLFGYVAILIAWLVVRYASGQQAAIAAAALFVMTVAGTLFSVYLTFLEPFVIGATCAWCLTSAVLMTLLMLLSAGTARRAFSRMVT